MESQQKEFLLKGIQYILEHNFFSFNNKFYRQVEGTAMGTRFAPSYANLFMGVWEDNFFHNDPLGANLVLYKRYIDDLVIIWKGSEGELIQLFERMNINNYGLKFVCNHSYTKVNFLDLEIMIIEDKIETKTYFKPVDCNNLIHADSCHLNVWKENIPYGQTLRIKRNCSRIEDYENQVIILAEKFEDRGYEKTKIDNAIEKARLTNREDLLKYKIKEKDLNDRIKVPFITDFSADHNLIKKIIRKHWHLLKEDNIIGDKLAEKPTFIFKKAKIFRSMLAPSELKMRHKNKIQQDMVGKIPTGFFPCYTCKACKHSSKLKTLNINSSEDNFNIRDLIRCTHKNIIYALKCSCNLFYFGETTRCLKDRIREHLLSIEKGREDTSLYKHFKEVHQGNTKHLNYWGIQKVRGHWRGGNTEKTLLIKEAELIYKFDTLFPKGLNSELDLSPFLFE